MYQLDVYSSTILGDIIQIRGAQARVSYPSEINDELVSNAGFQPANAMAPFIPFQPIKSREVRIHH